MKCYPVLSSVLLQKSFSCAEHCSNFGKEDCIVVGQVETQLLLNLVKSIARVFARFLGILGTQFGGIGRQNKVENNTTQR